MNGGAAAGIRVVLVSAATGAGASPPAALPTAGEIRAAAGWFDSHLGGTASSLPWSFAYDGRASAGLIDRWNTRRSLQRIDERRTRHTLSATDPATGLEVRCVSVLYLDFPAVEWTLFFKNTGDEITPLLSDILAIDDRIERNPDGEFLLHHSAGSRDAPTDFRPLETPLRPNFSLRIAAVGGRPTGNELSFFNVEWPGQGAIIALGWPGQWAAQFTRDAERGLRVGIGQETTRLRLRPGEEIRSPLVALLLWQGDWLRSQNLWRRWMIAHNLPRPGGKPVSTHFASTYGRPIPTADVEIAQLDGWAREGIPLDYWILDAGWYPSPDNWITTGTWQEDPGRFPRGLREVADRAHARGTKFVVWFEPERVAPGTWLWNNHPEWLLGCPGEATMGPGRTPSRLLDLGNPHARKWLAGHIGGMLEREGIDVYRQDFNTNPLDYWRAADGPDRLGIAENAHVSGYLAFWDELLLRHPSLWIDTCASGGRRLDLETLRRSVPLLRSDWFKDAISQQCHTHGISLWIPLYGSGSGLRDTYFMRSSFCPSFRIGCDTRDPRNDYALLRRTVAHFRRIEPCLMGDYYPLTPYSTATNVWMAWQFDRPETGTGVVQAFRRPGCPAESTRFPLRGLDARAVYSVTDLDAEGSVRMTADALMTSGLPVTRTNRPDSAIITYQKAPSHTAGR